MTLAVRLAARTLSRAVFVDAAKSVRAFWIGAFASAFTTVIGASTNDMTIATVFAGLA